MDTVDSHSYLRMVCLTASALEAALQLPALPGMTPVAERIERVIGNGDYAPAPAPACPRNAATTESFAFGIGAFPRSRPAEFPGDSEWFPHVRRDLVAG